MAKRRYSSNKPNHQGYIDQTFEKDQTTGPSPQTLWKKCINFLSVLNWMWGEEIILTKKVVQCICDFTGLKPEFRGAISITTVINAPYLKNLIFFALVEND